MTDADDLLRSVLIGEAVDRGGYVVLVADDEMQFLTASDGALELLGYTRAELARLRVPDIVQEADAPDLYDEMRRAGRQDGQVTLLCKDGRRVPAAYRASETKVGSLTYYVSVLRPL